MFTGLVEEKGCVRFFRRHGGAASLQIAAGVGDLLKRGESIAVNGVCLTVVATGPGTFRADAVEQTLRTTTLADLRPGAEVNLERAVRVGERLGGHMLTGHVDGVGTVSSVLRAGNGKEVRLVIPEALVRHVADRGSIAVDGVSLTVARVAGSEVTVALIPETLRATTAASYHPGTRTNVETDLVAKYIEALGLHDKERTVQGGDTEPRGLTLRRLRELGFRG